jgi:hypothetical protein
MGMFDSVMAECPECGCEIEFQSKSGVCELKRYHISSVPPNIAIDLSNNDYHAKATCRNCKTEVMIEGPPVTRVQMWLTKNSNIGEWD